MPHPTFALTLDDAPSSEDVRLIGDNLSAYNRERAGDDYRPLAVFLRDPQDAIVGGLIGSTFWGWFAIDLFWVDEGLRGQGHGQRLLATAEEEAIRRGCRRVVLDTMSFQAPAFYLKRGYTVFGELPDFPPGHSRYYLVKRLRPAGDDPVRSGRASLPGPAGLLP